LGLALQLFWIESERLKLPAPFSRLIAEPLDADEIGPTAAGACLRRAREAGVGWPLPDDLDDDALENRLYPVPTATVKDWRSLPDWPAIHRDFSPIWNCHFHKPGSACVTVNSTPLRFNCSPPLRPAK
jgi:hypothetical protein